jgi:hypothetical protein
VVIFITLFILLSWAQAHDLCIRPVENPYGEPYLSYAFRKNLERAVLESGGRLRCSEGSQVILPRVKLFKETPIAYTPQQRVSAYTLELKLSLLWNAEEREFLATVPYSQPTGGLGDIPRRKAIEEAFGIIYLDMLQHIKRRSKDVDKP